MMKKRAAPQAWQLRDWAEQPPGDWVLACEKRILARFGADLFGYYLLQVGGFPLAGDYLVDCPVRHKARIDLQPTALASGPFIQAEPERLPVATDSVDVVVLPHTLDFANAPHQVLREVERVLIPEGRVLLTGFNPWSLWGLWRLFLGRSGRLPWQGHFLTYTRVEDWLNLMGFDIEYSEFRIFRPPFGHEGVAYRLRFLERFGKRFLSLLGGVYIVRAVRRVSTVTPIRPAWQPIKALEPGAIEPTTREGTHG